MSGSHYEVADFWPPPAARVPYARAVLRGLTWRRLLITEVIGTFIFFMRYLEAGGLLPPVNGPDLVAELVSIVPVLILLAAVCADEWVARRGRAVRAYTICLIAAACCGATLQAAQEAWMRAHLLSHPAVLVLHPWTRLAYDTVTILTDGLVVMFVFHARRSVERILNRLRATEFSRVQLERTLIDSRLAATQAQMDSAAMLASLTEIGLLYRSARQEADVKLDRLVESLQNRRSPRRTASPVSG